MRRWAPALPWLALAAAVTDWAGLRAGLWSHAPSWLAAGVAAVTMLFLLRLALAARRAVRGPRRGVAVAEALVVSGVLVALGAGSANWLLGFSGFVVLQEGETVTLSEEGQLQDLRTGPLARLDGLGLQLTLLDLALVPAGDGSFSPRSTLEVTRAGHASERVSVGESRLARVGPARLHQGAFGFAPRVVILEGERTAFDRVVPFTTIREGERGVAFAGSFTVAAEELAVDGVVDLASLDEGLRGHAALDLSVARGGRVLGRGRLLPGHFADVDDGWRIGFAGLEKWSEIDVSRRDYSAWILAGAAAAALGALAWPVAAWRSR